MSQVSYGTITITDTNDIESITVEYNRNQSSSNAPSATDSGWSTTRPDWAQGYYIWQRTRVHKSGTTADTDVIGTAVCITGSTGATGAAGQSLTATKTEYTIAASNVTINLDNHTSYTWTTNTPDYDSSKPAYWGRITNTYTNPAKTEYLFYKDEALTKAVADAAIANSIAAHANEDAQGAMSQASATQVAQEALASKLQRIWRNQHTYIYGNTYDGITWNKPNYPAGTYAASGIDGITFDEQDSSTYGFNSFLRHTFLSFRYNTHQLVTIGTGVATDDGGISGLAINTPIVDSTNKQVINVARGMELTSNSLTFYKPPTIDGITVTPGGKAMELTGTALKFYRRDTTENTDVVNASFSADEIILGEAEKEHITIDDDGLKIYGRYNSFDPYGPVTPAHWGTIASFGIKTQIGTEDTGHVIIDETGAFFYNTGGSTLPYLVAKIGNEGDIVEYDDYQETYSTTWNLGETLNFSFSRGPSDSGSQSIKCYIKEGDNLTLCTSYITIDDDNYEYSISGYTDGGSADFIITSTTENTTRSVDLVIIITYDASFVGPHYSFGMNTNSIGRFSIAAGQNTIALGKYQMVLGKFNEVKEDALFIIGNGTDDNNRSNLFVIDGEGNLSVQDGFKIISDENSELVLSSNGIDIKQNNISIAEFGADGTRIGQMGESYLKLNYRSMRMIDKDGNSYFNVYDFRDSDGNIIEERIGNGSTTYWTLNTQTNNIVFASLNGTELQANNDYWFSQSGAHTVFYLRSTPASGDRLVIIYVPNSEDISPYSYTLGTRNSIFTEGFFSVALGENASAAGRAACAEGCDTFAFAAYSHVQNLGTTATYDAQTVIGKYNTNKYTAFTIGNGTSVAARSNALTVDWQGRIECGNYSGALTSIFDIFYPVGSYYETSDSTFDPNTSLGGTWSSEEILDDEIVEEGTSGIWTYRKWKSGISECWGRRDITISLSNAYGGAYYGTDSVGFLTGLFSAEPTVSISRQGRQGTGLVHISPYSVSSTQIQYFITNTNSRYDSAQIGIAINARGLWKTYSAPTTKYRWHRTA